jgi:hypothetical protein
MNTPVSTTETTPTEPQLTTTSTEPQLTTTSTVMATSEAVVPDSGYSGTLASDSSSGASGNLKVSGKFVTPLSNDGVYGYDTSMKGIVWGRFEISRCSDGALFAYGLTDLTGKFSATIWNPTPDGFYVSIIPYSSAASVRTAAGGYDSFSSSTPCFYPTARNRSLNIRTWKINSGSGYVYRGAWMIYETIVNDARKWGTWNFFANKLKGYGLIMPYVIIRFPYETWAHYHTGGEIHLPTMNDARSPDVIQHEYAHFAMYQVFGTSFTTYCPSPHYITGVSHVNCAWSEGWASYVPYMTHGDKTYTYANNFDVNEEKPTWDTPGWDNGPAVEGRVTCALIDLSDSQNEKGAITKDKSSGLTLKLWYVFRIYGLNVNFHDFLADYRVVYGYDSKMIDTLWHNTIYYSDL